MHLVSDGRCEFAGDSDSADNPKLQPRSLDQVRAQAHYKHYSVRTEKAYLGWIKQFIRFHGAAAPKRWAGPRMSTH